MAYRYDGLRIAGGAVAAAAAAAAPTILLGPLVLFAFPIAAFIALAHAVLLGVPAFLLVSRHRRVDWGAALAAGFLIGFLPSFIFQLIANPGLRLSWGFSMTFGGCGLLGGAAFRAAVGAPRDPRNDGEVASVFE